jgi:putative ABC transport system permease protein
MNIRKLITEALHSLSSNKLRTGLTMLGIIIGVAAVVSMMAIGKGAQTSITNRIQSMGTNLVFVSKDSTVTKAAPITLMDSNAIAKLKESSSVIAQVAPSVQTNTTMEYAGNSTFVQLIGSTPNYQSVRNVSLSSGSFFTQDDYENSASVAVIGANVVTNLFSKDPQVIGKKVVMGNNVFTVIGIIGSQGGTSAGTNDNQVIVPLTTAQVRLVTRSSIKDQINLISISASSPDTVNTVISEVKSLMNSRHNISSSGKSDFTVLSQEAITATATSVADILTVFLGGIGAISLLVGGIGIMNIMLVSVVERTREIGLRKALGARDSDILNQFMIESLIIGLTGGILGVLVGWGISQVIHVLASSGSNPLNPVVTVDVVLMATIFSIAVGLVFGIYPARRAAKLEPVEALRTE